MAGSRGLGALTLDLILKMGGFEQGLDKAGRALDKRGKQMEARARTIGKAIGIGITAGFAAGGALAIAIKSSIDRMDELSKAAQRASLPTEQFTQLAYAGSLADVSMEDLTKSLGKLAKAQGDAAAGLKTQNDAFNQLGIAFKNADGSLRSTRDVFLDFADAFQKYRGSPEVVAAGMQIFGRSFQTLIPLLKDGREGLQAAADEADRLGVTLSTKAGQEAEAFNDNLTRLKSATNGLFQSIAAELLPELVKLTDQFVAIASSGDDAKEIASGIATTFRVVGTVVGGISSFFSELGNVIEGVTEGFIGLKIAAQGVLSLDFDKIKQGLYVADDGAARARNPRDPKSNAPPQVIFAGEGKEPLGFFRNSAPTFTPPPIPSIKTGGGGRSRATKEALDFSKDAQRELEALIQKEADAREAFGAMAAQLAGPLQDAAYRYTQQQKELNQLATDGAIGTQELAKAQADLKRGYEEDVKAIQARLDPAKQVIADMQEELRLTGLSNLEREKAIALRYAGVNATEAERQAIAGLAEDLQKAREQAEFYNDTQRDLADALADFVTGAKSAKDAFGDFADALYRRAVQFLADKAIQSLFDMFKGNGGSSAGGATGGGFWANLIGGLFGGGKASGGTAMPNTLYRVNENGPEMLTMGGRDFLMMGKQTGLITAAAGSGFGGGSVSQTFVIQGSLDRRTEQQLAAKTGRAAQSALARNGR